MTDSSTSASEADSTRTMYGAGEAPRRPRRGGRGGRRIRRYPVVARLQIDAIPMPTTEDQLRAMHERIARDQAYIPNRQRLAIPASWDPEQAESRIVPGSDNNSQVTRRNTGPLAPPEWLDLEPTNGTFGTFVPETPETIQAQQAEWRTLLRGGGGAAAPAAAVAAVGPAYWHTGQSSSSSGVPGSNPNRRPLSTRAPHKQPQAKRPRLQGPAAPTREAVLPRVPA